MDVQEDQTNLAQNVVNQEDSRLQTALPFVLKIVPALTSAKSGIAGVLITVLCMIGMR